MTSDKKIDILWKAINKQGRYIEQLEVMVACLKKDSHPPKALHDLDGSKDLLERIKKLEKKYA